MGVLSFEFSKFRNPESPVFSAWQVDKYGAHTQLNIVLQVLSIVKYTGVFALTIWL